MTVEIFVFATPVDEDRAELWDCNALESTVTFWLMLAMTMRDAGSDLLEYDNPVTVTYRGIH